MSAIARWCFHRWVLVIVTWVIVLIGLGALAQGVKSIYTNSVSLPEVATVTSPYGPHGAAQISRNGRIAYATVNVTSQASSLAAADVTRVVNQAKTTLTGLGAGAVRTGQVETGRVITAASAIMICVFATFSLMEIRGIAEFGIGLTVAVAVDAFILRAVLVPAAKHLFGNANWRLPRWLDRRLPPLAIEPSWTAPEPAREPAIME